MKIIKHGDITKIREYNVGLAFECANCGCQYVANTDDCDENVFRGRHMSYLCECPDCGFVNVNDD